MSEIRTNDAQIEYWNEQAGPKWVRHQEVLDQQIAPHGEAMLDRVGLRPGERVLDVGCGCGGTTLEIAARVGAKGSVTGLDISGPMLAHARQRAKRAGLAGLEFVQADAQDSALAESGYDAVTSRFGVMFFADPVRAFANLRGTLAKGGRLGFICWRTVRENPWVTLPMMEAARFVELPPPPGPDEPGPFAFGERDRISAILSDAGYVEVEIDPFDHPMRLGASADLESAVEMTLAIGPLSRLITQVEESLRPAIRDAVRSALAAHHSPEGVALPSAAWIVLARKG
jgi:SAM-dependent methyltransferase